MKLHKFAVASVAALALSAQPLMAQTPQGTPAGANTASTMSIGGVAVPTILLAGLALVVFVAAVTDGPSGTTGTR